ncbi:MAG: hypothetical protein JG777_2455 [Clostridia bacterium]|nr:hypothetical protein [Clostridia bacterium]
MVSWIKKVMVLLNICLSLVMTTGCWNNRDVMQISLAAAVGLDKTDDNKIELTVQLVKPSAIKKDQEGSGGKEKAVWVLSSRGDTIFEAVRNTLTTANRKIFFSHVQLMIIGEELAREGIMDVLDFFERDHETNRKVDILIAKGTTAKEILNAESGLEDIAAMHITDILKNDAAVAKIKKIMLLDLLKEIDSPGKDPTIGVIEVVKKEEKLLIKDMKVQGTAVFKKDKLMGWLNPIETRGLLFVEDKVKSGIINIPNPLDKNKKVAIEMIRSRGKTNVQLKEDKLVLSIEVEEEGNIGEQQGNEDLTTPEMVKKLEEEIEEAIEKEIRDVVELAQKKYKCDIFGFGEIVHKKHLNYWKQVKDNWNEEFSHIPVEIKVTSRIRRSGLIKNPTKPE